MNQSPNKYLNLVESAASHLQAAAQITNIKDLRNFNMRGLSEVKVNLHLALELLEIVRKQASAN